MRSGRSSVRSSPAWRWVAQDIFWWSSCFAAEVGNDVNLVWLLLHVVACCCCCCCCCCYCCCCCCCCRRCGCRCRYCCCCCWWWWWLWWWWWSCYCFFVLVLFALVVVVVAAVLAVVAVVLVFLFVLVVVDVDDGRSNLLAIHVFLCIFYIIAMIAKLNLLTFSVNQKVVQPHHCCQQNWGIPEAVAQFTNLAAMMWHSHTRKMIICLWSTIILYYVLYNKLSWRCRQIGDARNVEDSAKLRCVNEHSVPPIPGTCMPLAYESMQHSKWQNLQPARSSCFLQGKLINHV